MDADVQSSGGQRAWTPADVDAARTWTYQTASGRGRASDANVHGRGRDSDADAQQTRIRFGHSERQSTSSRSVPRMWCLLIALQSPLARETPPQVRK